MLQNATKVVAQGQVEQFGLGLQNYADLDPGPPPTGGPLPTLPRGHVPVIYISIPEVLGVEIPIVTYFDYEVLFSGTLQNIDGTDAGVYGVTKLRCATPLKALKVRLHSVVFYSDPLAEPTDTSRIRRLGQMVEGQLPDWDFTTYVSPNLPGNITYPPAIFPNPNDGTSGELFIEYKEASIEEIIRNIATDPGWWTDVTYPLQARNWFVEGNFATPGEPESGIKWFLHYLDVPVPGEVLPDLSDTPDFTLATEPIIYAKGATFTEDYSTVIRQIHISGPSAHYQGRSYDPQPIAWEEPYPRKCSFRPGAIYKRFGEDGVWDSGAVSQTKIWANDWEVSCQCQELYLEHDTFNRPDTPLLLATHHGMPWYSDTPGNPIGIKDRLAVPEFGASQGGGLRGGMHISVLQCYATTCILRWHLERPRIGMQCVFRFWDKYNRWYVECVESGFDLVKMVAARPAS